MLTVIISALWVCSRRQQRLLPTHNNLAYAYEISKLESYNSITLKFHIEVGAAWGV